ncbi:MAG: RICIN domain-containing protein [Clostridia bacterium]|nr:RICIN domain-containing protein [Clostridia bacterium]
MKKFIALVLVLCLAVGAAPTAFADDEIAKELPGTEEESGFVHPGILNTVDELQKIADMIAAGDEEYTENYAAFKESAYAQSGAESRATETVIRGGNGDNCAQLYRDIQRAFQCAVVWYVKGSTAHGDTARDILNDWSATLTSVSGNADRYLASGLYGYQLANAAELMRDYEGFEKERTQDVLLNVFYKPLCERFLYSNEYGADHNDAYIQNYWANWDLANMAACVAIGIFCDRRDIYDKAVNYYKFGAGNGSIYNAIPYLYEEGLAQWQESGRDQGHVQLGLGLMASICEMAWNQNEDLYGWANNRLMYAAEYVAKYNNGEDVPFTEYQWGTGQSGELQTHSVVSDAGRGEYRAIYEMIYNHYAKRKGYYVPNIAARAEIMRVETGPGGHATTFDQPGYGTLLYTRDYDVESVDESETNIKNGVYKIKSRLSGKLLTMVDGTAYQYGEGAENQEFTLTHVGGGEYSIMIGDMALTVKDGSYENSAEIVLEEYTGSIYQRFAFIDLGDGYYKIIPVHSTKPLDVSGASLEDGAAVKQYRPIYGNQNQHWELEIVEEADNSETSVIVNGVKIAAVTCVTDGVKEVGLRAVFEAFDSEVVWNDETKSATIDTNITVTLGSAIAVINGQSCEMESAAKLVDGNMTVPLSLFNEIGCDVKIDTVNNAYVINAVNGLGENYRDELESTINSLQADDTVDGV